MAAGKSVRGAWVDEQVRRADPVGACTNQQAIGVSLEHAGRLILDYASSEVERPRARRALRAPRRLALIAVLVLGASGAAAAASGLFVNANTHTYAGHAYLHNGGAPGEFLNLAGTNLAQVVKKDSAGAGITFPAGRFDWRDYTIRRLTRPQRCPSGSARGCKAVESSGSINVNVAQAAIEAWILEWRRAQMTHNTVAAREAAAVIAKAPKWKAVTDDRASTLYEEDFWWLPPFVRAVAAGNVDQVNQLIASPVGRYRGPDAGPTPVGIGFPLDDPDGFAAWFARYSKRWDHLPYKQRIAHGRQEDAYFLRYLNRHGS